MAVTLNQIAEACGVSRGTVDRALRDKGQVRPELCEKIKRTAREMGYIPNQSRAPAKAAVRIGVVLHSAGTAFVKMVCASMNRTAAELREYGAEVIVRTMNGLDAQQQAALIDELTETERIDALAVMPLASAQIRDKLNALSERQGIPVVTFNSDIADCNRLAYVGTDNLASGQAAAALLGLATGGTGAVLAIAGRQNGHSADSQRMVGFLEEIQAHYPGMELLDIQQCFDDAAMAERIVLRTLAHGAPLAGIYVSCAGRSGVYRALRKADMAGKVHVIVHDLTPGNLRMIRDGVVDFAIGQDADTQGSLPLRLLYDYTVRKKAPEKRIYLTDIEIKFRCNLGALPDE